MKLFQTPEAHARAAEIFKPEGWKVGVEEPQLSAEGEWSDKIQIGMNYSHSGLSCDGRSRVSQIDRVLLDYTASRLLTIQGAEVTFNGKIKIKKDHEQIDQLETAFALAFHNPAVERPQERRSRSYPRGFGPFGNRRIIIGG